MQKIKRLLVIERIIAGETISFQETLLKKLKGKGIICTQATLSRDLRQIGVSRVPDGKGGYRYSMPGKIEESTGREQKLNILPGIKAIVEANGLMVMRTIPGSANATAYYIDNAGRYEIAGTIAGDDTILIIPRKGITLQQVHSCLEMIIPGLHRQIGENLTGLKKNKEHKNKQPETIKK